MMCCNIVLRHVGYVGLQYMHFGPFSTHTMEKITWKIWGYIDMNCHSKVQFSDFILTIPLVFQSRFSRYEYKLEHCMHIGKTYPNAHNVKSVPKPFNYLHNLRSISHVLKMRHYSCVDIHHIIYYNNSSLH